MLTIIYANLPIPMKKYLDKATDLINDDSISDKNKITKLDFFIRNNQINDFDKDFFKNITTINMLTKL